MQEPPSRIPVGERQPARARNWPWGLAVGLGALLLLGWDLSREPAFVDESAYFSQSYFAELFVQGRWNDGAWLEYMGYDLPPLPKYLIGASLAVAGRGAPGPAAARAWYEDTSRRFDAPGELTAARWPFVILGAVGCVAIFAIGAQAEGRATGLGAALLLVVNPLYHMHARRAMSDIACEAFLLVSLALALWAWRSWWTQNARASAAAWIGPIAAGGAAGLSLLSKMSGLLALMVAASWTLPGLFAPLPRSRKLGILTQPVVMACCAAVALIALNPYLTAQPGRALPGGMVRIAGMGIADRALLMVRLRPQVAADQQRMFPHNALHSPSEKVRVVAVQGFGRFGPLGAPSSDSTRRFDWSQDSGALLWLPVVLAGLARSAWLGARQWARHEAPLAWAIALYWLVAVTVVASYLPMAWDRYQLPIQAPSALLGASLIVSAARWPWRRRGE